MSRSRGRQAVTAVVVAATVASIGATAAQAKTVTVTDDTSADFTAATHTGTKVLPEGSVVLSRAVDNTFDSATLPAGWTNKAWPLLTDAAANISGGQVQVDGSWLNTNAMAGPGSSLVFDADFGVTEDLYRGVGFSADFGSGPWAMIGTGPSGITARVNDGPDGAADLDTPLFPPATAITGTHRYRIDWTATGFAFSVDGGTPTVITLPRTRRRCPRCPSARATTTTTPARAASRSSRWRSAPATTGRSSHASSTRATTG